MIIDFHRHLFERPNELDILIGEMEEYNIERTLLLPLEDGRALFCNHRVCGNEKVLEAVQQFPEKLIGAVYIDPRRKDTVDSIKRYRDHGFRFIKIWPCVGYYPDDPAFFPVYEYIASVNMPIIAHTGYTNIPLTGDNRPAASSKYSHPLNFDLLFRKYPEIRFILAHCGDPYFNQAFLMCEANENVYLNPIYSADGWDGRFIKIWESQNKAFPIMFDKLIWGSDNLPLEDVFGGWEDFFRRNGEEKHIEDFYGHTALTIMEGLDG